MGRLRRSERLGAASLSRACSVGRQAWPEAHLKAPPSVGPYLFRKKEIPFTWPDRPDPAIKDTPPSNMCIFQKAFWGGISRRGKKCKCRDFGHLGVQPFPLWALTLIQAPSKRVFCSWMHWATWVHAFRNRNSKSDLGKFLFSAFRPFCFYVDPMILLRLKHESSRNQLDFVYS